MTVPPTVEGWLSLVTSAHSDKPKFIASLTAFLQPLADNVEVLDSFSQAFDLDIAQGVQLDVIGQWVGVTRYLTTPLTGVYFSLDDPNLGLDQGSLQGPFDPVNGLTVLPDDAYQNLLRARIAANHWDGTIPNAYEIFAIVFQSRGFGLLIQDGQDMTMIYALTGPQPDAVTLQLFIQGYLALKPAGVTISNFFTPGVPNAPYFGLDSEGTAIAGLDVGAFGNIYPGI